MSQQAIEEIEVSITEAKKMVSLGSALERLLNNRDFKRVILEEYLDREAVRLVHLKADHNSQDEAAQKGILTQMDAIGSFTNYCRNVTAAAERAKHAIEDGESELDGLRQEGDA